MKKIGILSALLAAFSLFGCQKTEGEGGTSSIQGSVFINDYDNNGDLKASYYAPDEDIYIMYGDNSIYDDSKKTNFDGAYKFSDLFPGDYTLFAYSKCDACPSGIEPVFVTVNIEHKGMKVEAPLITVKR